MKKIITALLIAALLTASFAGCKNENKKPGESDSTSDTVYNAPQTNMGDESAEPTRSYEYTVEEQITVVSEASSGRSTKCLLYPVLKGFSDTAVQEEINSLLLEEAEKVYKATVKDIDIYIEDGTLFFYEVTACSVEYASDAFISVKSEITFTNELDEYPLQAVYTTNIDLAEKRCISGSDIFSDFITINNKFISGKFKQEYGIEKLLTLTNYSDMILQYKSDRGIYPNVFFRPGYLIINIDLTDSLGSAAGFSIPISEIKDSLKYIPH